MNLNDYQTLASRTDLSDEQYFTSNIYVATSVNEGVDALMSLVEVLEAGKRLDTLKKKLVYKADLSTPELRSHYDNNPLAIQESRELHGMLGIITELPELFEALSNKDRVNIGEELADIMWYVALIATSQGLQLDKLGEANIAKLQARFPDKFSSESALVRNLTVERSILESGV